MTSTSCLCGVETHNSPGDAPAYECRVEALAGCFYSEFHGCASASEDPGGLGRGFVLGRVPLAVCCSLKESSGLKARHAPSTMPYAPRHWDHDVPKRTTRARVPLHVKRDRKGRPRMFQGAPPHPQQSGVSASSRSMSDELDTRASIQVRCRRRHSR